VPAKRIDLTKVEVKPFDGNTVVNRFSCGRTPVDRFLKNKAKKADRRSEHRIFCAHLDGSPNCIGYYALQLGTDSVADLPDVAKQTYLKNYVAFPAVHLSFLGVHEEYRRQGLGSYLLMDVFSKVAEISKHAGFFALTLQSLDDDSTAFYKSLGFAIYSENLKQPKMLYPLEDILTLVSNLAKV
jgi:ribosomal protein S18 acetylase RimI-like enzyme